LILNTIAHTVGATMAGAYGVEALGQSRMLAFSMIFTASILVFTEILPKTAGVVYWRSIWPYTVWPLTAMIYALYPLIWLTEKLSRLIMPSEEGKKITQEEIVAFIRLGQKEGEISRWESLWLHNIIQLKSKPVNEIMTPRTVIISLEADTSVYEALQILRSEGFSRVPIYQEESENICGYIHIRDVYQAQLDGFGQKPIKMFMKPIAYIPESKDSLQVLAQFLARRHHIAIVVDEYGGVAGLVTLEDVVETVLGSEIVDEMDKIVDMQSFARQSALRKPVSS
jgi:CBS domain containing-hemolysin-like protein